MTLTPDAARRAAEALPELIERARRLYGAGEATAGPCAAWLLTNGETALAALRAVAQGQEHRDLILMTEIGPEHMGRVLIVPIEPTERSPSTHPGTPGTAKS